MLSYFFRESHSFTGIHSTVIEFVIKPLEDFTSIEPLTSSHLLTHLSNGSE
jgi:hypothetical protein